jgi:hypothetical protein
MADIPGIQFTGSPGVMRANLSEANLHPKTESGYVYWPSAGGSTSASPAHRRAFADLSGLDNDELIRWVWEGVELPGQASDYHFLLQGAVDQLWGRRREYPSGLNYLETFGYLDLALIEAIPQAVQVDKADHTAGYYHISSLDRLLALLEREGAIREALALSRRALRFGERYRNDDLEAKAAALDGELS